MRRYEGPAGTPEQLRERAAGIEESANRTLSYVRHQEVAAKRKEALRARSEAAVDAYYARLGRGWIGDEEKPVKPANAFEVYTTHSSMFYGMIERQADEYLTRTVVEMLEGAAARKELAARQFYREARVQFEQNREAARAFRHRAAVLRYFAREEEKR